MTRRYLKYSFLAVLAAGFVLACGAGRAGAQNADVKVVTQAKEGKKKKKTKKIKILKAGDCCPGHEWYTMKKRGFLGVHLMRLNEELREHFGAGKDAGVLVAKVEKDSPAEKAGVKVGDVLAEVDDQQVGSLNDVIKLIGKKKEGEKASLKIFRRGKAQTLTATIQERERGQIEISKFVRKIPGGEEIELEVDTAPFEEAMEHAHEYLEKFHDGEEGLFKFRHKVESDLEERLKELEVKLKLLEKKLQGKLRSKAFKRTT